MGVGLPRTGRDSGLTSNAQLSLEFVSEKQQTFHMDRRSENHVGCLPPGPREADESPTPCSASEATEDPRDPRARRPEACLTGPPLPSSVPSPDLFMPRWLFLPPPPNLGGSFLGFFFGWVCASGFFR